ncbi:MAG: NUDIX hydrolase [Actinomycetes bacterium]
MGGVADQPLVEAAGGVLWRSAGDTGSDGPVEVALVHRPRYDDWSIPKGKLDPGEHPLLAALREVEEETGSRARPGPYLAEARYVAKGRPKRVRYWAMEAAGGAFVPSREVDEVRWLPLAEAFDLVAADRDRPVLDAYATLTARARPGVPTVPSVLLRHAGAGDRDAWAGPDGARPLDPAGGAQAKALVGLLGAHGVTRVVSSDTVRCLDTVTPYAVQAGLHVESDPLWSEPGFAADPTTARARYLGLVCGTRPTALCTHGSVIEDLVVSTCQALNHPVPEDPTAGKGGMWVFHLVPPRAAHRPDGAGGPRLVALERHDPVA